MLEPSRFLAIGTWMVIPSSSLPAPTSHPLPTMV